MDKVNLVDNLACFLLKKSRPTIRAGGACARARTRAHARAYARVQTRVREYDFWKMTLRLLREIHDGNFWHEGIIFFTFACSSTLQFVAAIFSGIGTYMKARSNTLSEYFFRFFECFNENSDLWICSRVYNGLRFWIQMWIKISNFTPKKTLIVLKQ